MADTKISALTSYTTPLDADVLPVVDTANTLTKKVTWANLKATLKTYFDTQYQTAGSSGRAISINSISTPTTAGSTASTDYVYLVSGTTTLTLPTAVSNTNTYYVKNVSGTTTIATTSSQTIDGSTSASLPVQYTALTLVSDGTNWNII